MPQSTQVCDARYHKISRRFYARRHAEFFTGNSASGLSTWQRAQVVAFATGTPSPAGQGVQRAPAGPLSLEHLF
jgi:hypothetical protein